MRRPLEAKPEWARAAVAGAVTMLLASLAAPLAQQQQPAPNTQKPAAETQKAAPDTKKPAGETQKPAPETQKPPAPAQTAPGKPLVPLAASTLATHPDPYYGDTVTVTAPVEQLVGDSAFSVDQDATKATGKEVLVIAPRLNQPVAANAYVTVLGEVVKLDAAELTKRVKDFPGQLPADAVTKFTGKPVIFATAVINNSGIDLAKRLPPPMTPQEEAFQKVMKRIGPAFAELRKGMDASDANVTKTNAVILKEAFDDTAAFWKQRGKSDAEGWARDAKKVSETIEKAANGGKWDEVKASATNVGKSCQTCHGAYRERFDDGSFRVKSEGGTKGGVQ